MKSRLAEIEQEIGPLLAEAEALRSALGHLEGLETPASSAPKRRSRRASPSNGRTASSPTPARRARRTATGRAPRGRNRQVILEAIASEAKTAGQIAKETGIGRGTVATTLTKLVSDGKAAKAARGYQAV